MLVCLHGCVQEGGDVDGKPGQGLDADLTVHPLYILSFEPCDCVDNSEIKFYRFPALGPSVTLVFIAVHMRRLMSSPSPLILKARPFGDITALSLTAMKHTGLF